MMTTNAASRFVARLLRVYRTNGIGEIGRKLLHRVHPSGRAYRQRKRDEDHAFDAEGYDTGGIQRVYGMALAGERAADAAANHIAVSPAEFRRALDTLDLCVDGFTFIDLGSGKGRAVLLAADEPFARIVGVEFARELHEVAEANLDRRRARHGDDRRVSLVHGDATTVDYPDEPIVLFLFNPFDPPVLTKVIANALASWRRSPRPFRVVYLNPVHLHAWTEGGWRLVEAGGGLAIYAPPDDVPSPFPSS